MSWWFSMQFDACEHCGRDEDVQPDVSMNYTYNVSSMFAKAIPTKRMEKDRRSGEMVTVRGIRALDGMVGEIASHPLKAAIEAMEADPAEYKKLNPENGWGNYDGALKVLKTIAGWCEIYPKAKLCVS